MIKTGFSSCWGNLRVYPLLLPLISKDGDSLEIWLERGNRGLDKGIYLYTLLSQGVSLSCWH